VTFPFFGDLLGFFGGFGFTPTSFFVSRPEMPQKFHRIFYNIRDAGTIMPQKFCCAAPLHFVAEDQEASEV
jgi:hypothetical protein